MRVTHLMQSGAGSGPVQNLPVSESLERYSCLALNGVVLSGPLTLKHTSPDPGVESQLLFRQARGG